MNKFAKLLAVPAVVVATLATVLPASAAVSAPSVPRYVKGTGGLHSVTIRWSTPSSTGGSAITGYTAKISDIYNNTQSCDVNASTFTCTFNSGLVDFRSYYATVKATNAIGTSINSPTTTVAPYGSPLKPHIYYGYYDSVKHDLTIRFLTRSPYPDATYTVIANGSTEVCTTAKTSCVQHNVVLSPNRDQSGANFAETLSIYQTIGSEQSPVENNTEYLYSTGCTTTCDVPVVGTYLMINGGSLAGADLRNIRAYSSYFSGVNMTGANISNSSFSGTVFRSVNMSNVTANTTSFLSSYWYDTNVNGTSFVNDNWNHASSATVTGTPAQLPGRVVAGHIICPLVYMSGVDFTGQDLSNLNLSGIDFTWANLTNANLNNSTAVAFFLHSNVSGATFTGATFINPSTKTSVSSAGLTGTPSTLPTDWFVANGFLVGPGAFLSNRTGFDGIDLSNRNLRGVQFAGDTLNNVNFAGSNLSGASFKNAVLNNVNLGGANLASANLSGASGTVSGTPSALPWGYKISGGVLSSR